MQTTSKWSGTSVWAADQHANPPLDELSYVLGSVQGVARLEVICDAILDDLELLQLLSRSAWIDARRELSAEAAAACRHLDRMRLLTFQLDTSAPLRELIRLSCRLDKLLTVDGHDFGSGIATTRQLARRFVGGVAEMSIRVHRSDLGVPSFWAASAPSSYFVEWNADLIRQAILLVREWVHEETPRVDWQHLHERVHRELSGLHSLAAGDLHGCLGAAEADGLTPTESLILSALREHGPLTQPRIEVAVGASQSAVRHSTPSLQRRGLIHSLGRRRGFALAPRGALLLS
jgi:hypothetical protein